MYAPLCTFIPYLYFSSIDRRMASGRMWLQIGISGWLTGEYSLRCQPVDYSDKREVLRVGDVFRVINTYIVGVFLFHVLHSNIFTMHSAGQRESSFLNQVFFSETF